MGTCSSKSINNTIADPVKPEQIDTPADATIVDATTDIAPTEMPADAAPSDYAKPEAEVAVAEEPEALGSAALLWGRLGFLTRSAEAAPEAAPEVAVEAAPEVAVEAAPEAAVEEALAVHHLDMANVIKAGSLVVDGEHTPELIDEVDEEEDKPTLVQKLSKAFSNILPAAPKCMPSRPELNEEPTDAPATAAPA